MKCPKNNAKKDCGGIRIFLRNAPKSIDFNLGSFFVSKTSQVVFPRNDPFSMVQNLCAQFFPLTKSDEEMGSRHISGFSNTDKWGHFEEKSRDRF